MSAQDQASDRCDNSRQAAPEVRINVTGPVDEAEVVAAFKRKAPEHPISVHVKPSRAYALRDVNEIIAGWQLFSDVGCEDRATLIVVDKLTRFLDELLTAAVVVDDEGRLGLADDQRSRNVVPLTLMSHAVINGSLLAAENVVQILNQLLVGNAVDHVPGAVDDDLGQENSPSIGAPVGAGVGTSQPTDGEHQTGAAASSPAAAAPVPHSHSDKE